MNIKVFPMSILVEMGDQKILFKNVSECYTLLRAVEKWKESHTSRGNGVDGFRPRTFEENQTGKTWHLHD